MFFGKNAAACLLTLTGLSTIVASSKDATSATASGLRIYAYGSDISGQPVFYSDGNAYIGSVAPPGTGTSVNITFSTTDTTSPNAVWSISANTTSSGDSSAPPFPDNSLSFYIVPNGTFTAAGFGSNNGTLPTGSVTSGFILFGKQIAYKGDDGKLLLQFWAAATNATGVWGLYWNAAGASIDGAFPVVLKTTAPTVLTI